MLLFFLITKVVGVTIWILHLINFLFRYTNSASCTCGQMYTETILGKCILKQSTEGL